MSNTALGLPFNDYVVGIAASTTSTFTSPAVGASFSLSLNNSIPKGAIVYIQADGHHYFQLLAAVTTGGASPTLKALYYSNGQSGVTGANGDVYLTLASWRELQFGPYQFALSMQERNRVQKIPLIKKKVPFVPGEFNPSNSSMGSRSLEFFGSVGVGCLGSQGNVLATQDDLEAERSLLAGLQALGKQQLWVRPDRYLNAWLEEFTFTYMDGTGYRFADWTAKFNADDPRYYGATTTLNLSNASPGPTTIAQNGNNKAFPIITFTATSTITAPWFKLDYGGGAYIKVTFSLLGMNSGDVLVVACDPRPESTQNNAVITLSGISVNAWPYMVPVTDFDNTANWQYFLPYIETSLYGQGTQAVSVGVGSGSTYTVAVEYADTWV